MFEIRDFHRKVFVDGNILFDSDIAVSYVDLVAYSTIQRDQCSQAITTNKTIDQNGELIQVVTNELIQEDDAVYYSPKDISSYGYEKKLPNPYNCIYTYNNNILDINAILESDINKTKAFGSTDISCNLIFRTLNSLSSVNRMLYQTVLSNYELFAMDILVTCFLRFEKVRNSYLERIRFNGLSNEDIILKLRSYQYNSFKDEIENLFLTLLDVELPDYSYLIEAYKFRNDFAHRYFTTKFGEAIVVTNESLNELIRETNKFVYELFERVIKKVYLPKG